MASSDATKKETLKLDNELKVEDKFIDSDTTKEGMLKSDSESNFDIPVAKSNVKVITIKDQYKNVLTYSFKENLHVTK